MNRTLVVSLGLSVVALIVSFVVLAYASVSNQDRVRDIAGVISRVQQSRFEATRQACLLRNEQSRTIIRFVIAVSPQREGQVRRAFEVEPDCAAFARARVRVTQP